MSDTLIRELRDGLCTEEHRCRDRRAVAGCDCAKIADHIERLRAGLKEALGQWALYADMVEANEGFDLAKEKSPEGDKYRRLKGLTDGTNEQSTPGANK